MDTHTQIALNDGLIHARVNTSNRFTKAEMTQYRQPISLARKARREALKGMNRNEQDANLAALRERYRLDLTSKITVSERADGRNYATIVLEEKKADVTRASRMELEQENTDLRNRLEKLERMFETETMPAEMVEPVEQETETAAVA